MLNPAQNQLIPLFIVSDSWYLLCMFGSAISSNACMSPLLLLDLCARFIGAQRALWYFQTKVPQVDGSVWLISLFLFLLRLLYHATSACALDTTAILITCGQVVFY